MKGQGATGSFNVKQGRFILDTRKKFFTMRMVEHWYRQPREVVDVPALETFKVEQVRVLSKCKVLLLTAGQDDH